MNVFAGTSGYSYKEWCGPFYSEGTKPADMLSTYAARLPTVEINNTFYRMPRANVVQNWFEQTPDDFRFTIKASRRITHSKKLNDVSSELGYLKKGLVELKHKLAVVLFQLPPFFKKDMQVLESFLTEVSDSLPVSLEFRHESWFHQEVYQLLGEKNAALCLADNKDWTGFVATTSWASCRWRQSQYQDQVLLDRLKEIRDTGCEDLYVYFKHEDEGAAPLMALRTLDLAARL